jgi:hypothetical protein
MNIRQVRGILLWSAVINFGMLALWGMGFLFARDWMYWAAAWTHLSAQQMDVVQVAGMTLYKMGIFLFNLVPYIAMRIVADK